MQQGFLQKYHLRARHARKQAFHQKKRRWPVLTVNVVFQCLRRTFWCSWIGTELAFVIVHQGLPLAVCAPGALDERSR